MTHAAWLVDLDGTLYRPKPVKLLAGIELCIFGFRVLGAVQAFRRQHEAMRHEEARGECGAYRLQLERTAAELSIPIEALDKIVVEWLQQRPAKWIRRFRRTSILDEIESFRAGGGLSAVVTDYPARVKLEALGATALFDEIVASGEEGGPDCLKPMPDGYLAAAERLGVAPADCLVIGDRDDADGEAARRAGMAFRLIR